MTVSGPKSKKFGISPLSEGGVAFSEYLFVALLILLILIITVTFIGENVVALLTQNDLINAWD
jgi:hypothetical protein